MIDNQLVIFVCLTKVKKVFHSLYIDIVEKFGKRFETLKKLGDIRQSLRFDVFEKKKDLLEKNYKKLFDLIDEIYKEEVSIFLLFMELEKDLSFKDFTELTIELGQEAFFLSKTKKQLNEDYKFYKYYLKRFMKNKLDEDKQQKIISFLEKFYNARFENLTSEEISKKKQIWLEIEREMK